MTIHKPVIAADISRAFDAQACAHFAAAYPDRMTKLNNGLAGHPLLGRDALALLADRMPAEQVEYNLGRLPLDLRPEDTPLNGLSVGETVRSIADNESWVVLKNVERDADYAALLDYALAPLVPIVAAQTGEMLHREAFIFITSPDSVTPFHMDPEHNILLQIEGNKTTRADLGQLLAISGCRLAIGGANVRRGIGDRDDACVHWKVTPASLINWAVRG